MSEDLSTAQSQSVGNSDSTTNTTVESVPNAGPNIPNIILPFPGGSADIPNTILPFPVDSNTNGTSRIESTSTLPVSFTNGNFKINLEYQERFYKQCLITERITSYISLGLIICGVIFTLGAILYTEIKGLPVNTYSVFSGAFTSVIGGSVYALNIGARKRIHDTAKELSNLGNLVIAKDYIDLIANPEKKDDQLIMVIQELVRPTGRNNQA